MNTISYDTENPSHIKTEIGPRAADGSKTVTITNLKTKAIAQYRHPGRRHASAATCDALFQAALNSVTEADHVVDERI